MKYLLISLLVVMSTVGNASEVCTGKIERLGISPTNGDVHIQIQPSTGMFQICNVDEAWGRLSTETCKTMYSTFLAARMSGMEVSLMFPDGFSCSSLGSWAYPSAEPTFFEIEHNF